MADYGCNEELVDKMVSEFPDSSMLYTYPRTTTKAQLKQMYMDVMNGKYT